MALEIPYIEKSRTQNIDDTISLYGLTNGYESIYYKISSPTLVNCIANDTKVHIA